MYNVVYWLRQILALVIGIVYGRAGSRGATAIISFVGLVSIDGWVGGWFHARHTLHETSSLPFFLTDFTRGVNGLRLLDPPTHPPTHSSLLMMPAHTKPCRR